MQLSILKDVSILLLAGLPILGQAEDIRIEKVFGPETPTGQYKHPSSITDLRNGDLYLVYYGGEGEYAVETSVFGSHLSRGSTPQFVTHPGDATGTATTILTVSNTTVAMSGDQFRCVATNSEGSINSDAAELSVEPRDVSVPLSIPNPSPAKDDLFGNVVAGLGQEAIIVGAKWDDFNGEDAGLVYVFRDDGALISRLENPEPGVRKYFGHSVAAVGNDRVLIGALSASGVDGAGYLFSTNGTLLTTVFNPDSRQPQEWDGDFGFTVSSVGSDGLLIGAPWGGGSGEGVVFLFDSNGTLLRRIANPEPTDNDQFGYSIGRLGDDRILVGARRDDAGAEDAGIAYLFSVDGNLLTTFTNPAPVLNDKFGVSVQAVGELVAVGANGADSGMENVGIVYLFNTNGVLQQTITNPDPHTEDNFGWSLAALGKERLVVGSLEEGARATNGSAVYLFGTSGCLVTGFNNPLPTNEEYFRLSVGTLGNDRVIVGAYGHNSFAGMVYLFHTSTVISPVIRINGLTISGEDYVILVPSTPGWSFQLQRKNDLNSPAWIDEGPSVDGDGSVLPLIHSGGATWDKQFYQAIATEIVEP